MQLSFLHLLALFAIPAAVSACEGECIVGITKAFIGNYSTHIDTIFENVGSQISTLLLHHRDVPNPRPSLSYIKPLLDDYQNQSYASMEAAIFPGFFHGKCQRDGVDPPGCPNPDCPVVCGTPGSLVHFYSKLRLIAFNDTRSLLASLASPGSAGYQQVERVVLANASGPVSRTLRIYGRSSPFSAPPRAETQTYAQVKRSDDVKARLEDIMKQIPAMLEKECEKGLQSCSWEKAMKEYILSFP